MSRRRADTVEPTDTSLSGRARTVSIHDNREFGSRTSIAMLPSLPQIPANQSFSPDTSINQSPQSSALQSNVADTSYVEFDLSAMNQRNASREILSEKVISSALSPTTTTANETPQSTPKEEKEKEKEAPADDEDDFFNGKSSGWKTMKKISSFDYYNEQGQLEFTPDQRFESVKDKDDIRAYTKIDTEEQLAKYAELDKKTDFLFEIKKDENHNSLHEDDEEEDEYSDYEENIDSEEALQGTKEMLTEAQRFAYVGIAKLIAVDMATDLAQLQRKASNRLSRTLNSSQKNFANWTLYVMSKLYEHIDLTNEEQRMIENLSIHGLEVSDLSGSLMSNANSRPAAVATSPGFDIRWVIICDLFLVLLSDGYYDSRSRSLFVKFAEYLEITPLEVHQFERRLIECLELDTSNKTIENKDELLADRLFIDRHIKKNRRRRLAYIGLATLGGGLAIGLSAGLLAPVIGAGIAAGLTTVGIGGTSGFLAGVGGSAIITTGGVVAGVRVGSKAGAKRAGDVHTFEFKPLHNNKRTNLIITVSGWMNGQADDVRLPFSTVDPVMGDVFSLLWEPEMLQSMGQTIGILASEALSTSIQQILGATILTALMSAIQLPMALSKLSYLLDNPWNVSLDRAWKAGKILADTLISGNMGVRPVTLVGFSLGSRLIYSCLIELAKRGGYGIVENVILLGNPIAVKNDQIILAKTVVSGKFINGYSKKDWILGYLFRATGGGILTVAGLSPIEGIYGIDNVDCTEFVEGHMSYRQAIPRIMRAIGWEVLSDEFAEIEEPDPEQAEKTRKLIDEFDEAKTKMMKEQQSEEYAKQKKSWTNWFKPKQKEWWDYVDDSKGETPAGEGTSTTTGTQPENNRFNEYEVDAENSVPIFDVGALMDEINDIEKLGNEDLVVLQKVRQDVDTQKREFKSNEETEEEEPSLMANIASKLPGKGKTQ